MRRGGQTRMWQMFGLPQTIPWFASGLRGFGHANASMDRWGTALDDLRLDTLVRSFAGVLWVRIGDALTGEIRSRVHPTIN